MKKAARILLGALFALSLCASFLPGERYERQQRDLPGAAPSWHYPLGTDDLGRDRFARLAYASAISLALSGGAAAVAILFAALAGGAAGYFGGWCDACIKQAIDLMLSLPWLFLLVAIRALLPLNAAPLVSLAVTYALLALLGWPAPARVVRAGVRDLSSSEFVLRARAEGASGINIVLRQILPSVTPALAGQFWTAIPVMILAEANLGFLGLSAAEPFPTWGGLLRELQNPLLAPAAAFAPIVAIVLALLCFKSLASWGGSQV